MAENVGTPGEYGLDQHGLSDLKTIHWTLPISRLMEYIVRRGEGQIVHNGAVAILTGKHTGRSPNDKFIVRGGESETRIAWGDVNVPMTEECFEKLHKKVLDYFKQRDVFVQDVAAGANPKYKLPIRVITENAWQSLFARHMFLALPDEELVGHIPEYTVLHAPNFQADPEKDCTNSEAFIIVNFSLKLVLIGGTKYAGEIKKSIFTILNYLLPQKDVLSMHCSANQGKDGDVALFFGLSGTGKTTLSSDVERDLIGDDEHGWGEDGVFNFEGGSYAKTIRLSPKLEPIIWKAAGTFGTVLENVVVDPLSRKIDFDDGSYTENTRAAYSLSAVKNRIEKEVADHPPNVFFLTADAFGVLPPISYLSSDQAQYYFLSGYTSKLAGTEKGLGTEPQATFSACFGEPFLPLHPREYAELLGKQIERHKTRVWLVNTGWTGGPFGIGERMKLEYTRAMVHAAIQGDLNNLLTRKEPHFGLQIPESCPGVPAQVLDPRSTWEEPEAYDRQAAVLVKRFINNFQKFEEMVSAEVISAGPTLGD
ncbi:MAG: phosphoenolpyruvate carboxykinase (ATP) [Chloroflexi bacterium]|nr:phosphoenolpyruvate carboxykinase (ATP) [Chloroflexota bacterium]